ncbi:MAG: nitroreductase family protein [Acidimicrobiia bacterium]|nr:nitroreductase family protein [Acidimicrobiia bacterium]
MIEPPFDLSETDRLLTTTRAVRRRLDLERAVERSVILECVEIASQAPTGSNRQGWRWIVVDEPDLKKGLADLYRRGAMGYLTKARASAQDRGDAQTVRVFESTLVLADTMQDVPALVIPCIEAPTANRALPATAWSGLYGSIFPAIWSFQLALRSRGLGSTLTTLHLQHAQEAAELLGIPNGTMQAALLPVAYTIGTDFKPAARPPAETIVHWNHW